MPSQSKPLHTYSQIWEIPEGLNNYNDLIKGTFQRSMETFLLDYADPVDATDDSWYYTNLKDYLYEMEQDPFKGDSLSREAVIRYQKDPERVFTLLYETIGPLFEEAVELNKEAINHLYEGYVIKGLTVTICPSYIALVIRGFDA